MDPRADGARRGLLPAGGSIAVKVARAALDKAD